MKQMITPQKLLSDALERVQLNPAVATLKPIEQALKAAALLLLESAPNMSSNADYDSERYLAGLAYLVDGQLQADGHEDETSAPYYFGYSAIKAFEAGAVWQDQRSTERK
ncbi:hypothetical protein ACI77O_12425 [Pseudomonas tritici]|uniref:hypothetical protein n=1 Tax=Pseudomonas tritici TaxID=2745518 RepID=UPI00387B4764